MVSRLGEVMWVVDLNRRSLDRVVPDIAAGRLRDMFEAAGWHCVMVKYGARLQGRRALRARIGAMPNEEAIAGGYRLRPHDAPDVAIAVMGALVPEAVEAVDALAAEAGIAAEGRVRHERRPPVPLLPGPRGARRRRSARSPGCSRTTSPSSPLLDGHPHALAFLGGRVTCPGVQRFGQSGDLRELYEHREIDAESVIGAALDLRGG
ncbi:MAG TPA: hypothetical protein VN213_16510 [Solirubrobacteraceae bacterium]|nr:hypothetical protein [Solirubrobacteraceae bacterium]